MASKIVYKPDAPKHSCRPGWTSREMPVDESMPHPLLRPGTRAMVAPTPWDFPTGTVVECDCGKTYVSLGAVDRSAPGMCYFRREGWFEKRRRERREARYYQMHPVPMERWQVND